jgi:hypothetical protein
VHFFGPRAHFLGSVLPVFGSPQASAKRPFHVPCSSRELVVPTRQSDIVLRLPDGGKRP